MAGRFIETALSAVEAAVQQYLPDLLAANNPPRPMVREFRRGCNYIMQNPPTIWTCPERTDFAEEGNPPEQSSDVTLRIGFAGSDPEAMVAEALDYVRLIDACLRNAEVASSNGATVLRIYVRTHEYGPLFSGRGLAFFPALFLRVVMEEVL